MGLAGNLVLGQTAKPHPSYSDWAVQLSERSHLIAVDFSCWPSRLYCWWPRPITHSPKVMRNRLRDAPTRHTQDQKLLQPRRQKTFPRTGIPNWKPVCLARLSTGLTDCLEFRENQAVFQKLQNLYVSFFSFCVNCTSFLQNPTGILGNPQYWS